MSRLKVVTTLRNLVLVTTMLYFSITWMLVYSGAIPYIPRMIAIGLFLLSVVASLLFAISAAVYNKRFVSNKMDLKDPVYQQGILVLVLFGLMLYFSTV